MFDGYWRRPVGRVVDPLGRRLAQAGFRPNVVTVVGVALASVSALSIGSGRLGLGAGLLVAAALADLVDGAVAKARAEATTRGAFLDSTADRVSDSLVVSGVIWHLVDTEPDQTPMIAVAVLVLAWLISYQRAKAESLGLDAKGGLMERGERVVVLTIGLAVPGALVPALWALLFASAFTAVQRFVKIWRQTAVSA